MTDHHHDPDTVVVREDRGTGLGTILGILAILLLLAAVWYMTLGPGAGGSTNEGGSDNDAVPSLSAPSAAPTEAPAES